MTRAELIRKIAKYSGVPDYEAKYFFETFLQKALGYLQPNQSVKVNRFGYFQRRQAAVKVTSTKDQKAIQSDVILFSPEEEGAGSLVFNIPANPDEKYNLIDSYFSLSIGKPVIPLAGVKSSELFLQPIGIELKKLIESKAEKLLSESEIVTRKIEEDDFLVIKKTSDDQFDIELSGEKIVFENPNPIEAGRVSEFEHVAWDFGEDLSKQIEEESILDVSSESSLLSAEDSNEEPRQLGWDFSQPETEEDAEENFAQPQEDDEISQPNITSDKDEIAQDIENEKEEQKNETESSTDKEDFERVKSITLEIEPEESNFGLTKSELNLSWDFDNQSDTKEFNEEQESISEMIDAESDWAADKIDTISSEKEEEVFAEGNLTNSGSAASILANESKLKEYSYSKRRSPFVFFIAMVTILTVGAVVVVYLTGNSFTKLSKQLFGSNIKPTKQIKPEIINRSFEVPVTYPYAKNNSSNAAGNEIDPKVFKANNSSMSQNPPSQTSNLSSLLDSKKDQIAPAASKIPVKDASSQKVKNNIYFGNGNYIVQISSWKSKATAESEALRYGKEGYNALVETAQVPGRGTWYRVKVGNFKTLSEAERFLNKNTTK